MDKKAKFLKIYANLPYSSRSEILVVVNDEPLAWNAARIEIENDTEIGRKILGKLIRLKILK